MTEKLPVIGVLPHLRVKGVSTPARSAETLMCIPVDEAMEQAYDTSALFTAYSLLNSPSWPRLNKGAVPHLVDANDPALTRLLVLEADNLNHAKWKEGEQQAFFSDFLAVATATYPFLGQWACAYTTPAGGRLIYLLDQWVGVKESERLQKHLASLFLKSGAEGALSLDREGLQWNRAYRLPFIVRDDGDTSATTLYEADWSRTLPLDLFPVLEQDPDGAFSPPDTDPLPVPSPEAVSQMLLPVTDSGRVSHSDWYRDAKKQLKGRECFPCIFENATMASPGRRDSTMHRMVGQACSLLARLRGTTPEHIYGLFLPAVEQFDPDAQTPDWALKLWSSVQRVWEQEQEKIAKEENKTKQQEVLAVSMLDNMVKGVSCWCDDPRFTEADHTGRQEYVMSILLASVSGTSSIYVMGEDGYYRPMPVSTSQLPSVIEKCEHLKPLIAYRTPVGRIADLKDIRAPHEIVTREVKGRSGLAGTYIEGISRSAPVMVMNLFKINEELIPEYSTDVDIWLRLLFGSNYSVVENWIAWSTEFQWPQAALSIVGAPSIGKQLFVRGLSEMLESPSLASEQDLVGKHGYGLLKSPFVVVNEGWPDKMQQEPSSVFRHMTGGDRIVVELKYLPTIEIETNPRLILTANNEELVKALLNRREARQQDHEAVLEKLLHVECPLDARDWLESKGGRSYTGKPGQAWVAGAGTGSSYILAKHFLWLGQNRRQPMGSKRMCVGGNGVERLHYQMIASRGVTPDVLEAITSILKQKNSRYAVVISGGKIFALPNAITEWSRQEKHPNQRSVTLEQVRRSLISIGASALTTRPFFIPGHENKGNHRWYEVDSRLVMEYAKEYGYDLPSLRQQKN